MLEFIIFPAPLTPMGFTLLLHQHFACATVWHPGWGLVCLSAGNGKCHAMQSHSKLTALSCGKVLLATYTNLSNFSASGFGLRSVCAAGTLLILPFPFLRSSDPLTHIIYLFFFFTMAVILALCPCIPRFVQLSSCSLLLTHLPCTHIHSQSPPPSPSCRLVHLVLSSPLDLNFGRLDWRAVSVCRESSKHKCVNPVLCGHSQRVTYYSVDSNKHTDQHWAKERVIN